MRWRRTDPVQDVVAMILTGPDAPDRLASALAAKSALFRSLPVEHGADWSAVFAAPLEGDGGESIVPRIPGATALYLAARDCWLPVGVVLDAPDHAAPDLWRRLREQPSIGAPMIVIPRFDTAGMTAQADVYIVRRPIPLDALQAGAVL